MVFALMQIWGNGGGDVKVVPPGKKISRSVHVHYGCSVTYLHKLGGLYKCLCGLTCRSILNILQIKPVVHVKEVCSCSMKFI